MGTIRFELEADESKAVNALLKLVDAQNKSTKAAKKMGDTSRAATNKSTQSLGAMGGVVRSVTGDVKSLISAYAGISGIQRAWRFVADEIKRAAAAQRELAEYGQSYNRSALALANQWGGAGTEAGQQVGKDVLGQLMTAGRFGSDYEKARTIGVGAHVTYGQPGVPLGGVGLRIAKTGAELAGYKDLGADEAGMMFRVLKQMGVTDYQASVRGMRQMVMTYEKALSLELNPSISGMTRFLGAYTKAGGTKEMGLARYITAFEGTGSEEEAASYSRRMLQFMRKEKVGTMLGRRRGISQEAFTQLPLDERMKAFGSFVTENIKNENALRAAGLEDRQIGFVTAVYGGGGAKLIQERMKWLQGAKAQHLLEELSSFGRTKIATEWEASTRAGLKRGRLPPTVTLGKELFDEYSTMHQRHMAGIEKLPYFRHDKAMYPEDWVWREESEIQIVGWRSQQARMRKLLIEGEKARLLNFPDPRMGGGYEFFGKEGAQWSKMFRMIQKTEPTTFDEFTPMEAGQNELMLQRVEDILRASKEAVEAQRAAGSNTPKVTRPNESLN